MEKAKLEKYKGYPCNIGVFQNDVLVAAVCCMQRWRAEDIAKEIGGTVRDLEEEPDFDWSIGSYEYALSQNVSLCDSVKTNNPKIIKKIWLENLFSRAMLITCASRNYVAGSTWDDSVREFPWEEDRKRDVFSIPMYRCLFRGLANSEQHVLDAAEEFFDSALVWATE